MFKIFLKIAGRQLWQAKLYASINIIGLATGTCCVLFAALYITDERSFDHFHQNNPNLYRITSTYRDHGQIVTTGGTGQVQGPAFQAQIPGILHYTRVMGGEIFGDVRHGHDAFKLQLLFVDSSFFNVFTFPLLDGDSRTALQNINSVVITRKTALKFFGRTDVTGEILEMDADPSAMRIGKPLVIAGVAEDPPSHSSIQFDILFPFEFMKVSFDDTSWLNAYLGTFLVLRSDTKPGDVTLGFNRIASSLSQTQRKENPEASPITYGLQNMTDIHFNPQEIANQNGESGIVNGSRSVYSYIFLGIAAFILLMASINFINLTIASSMKRAKEVGIRKATGGGRTGIIVQFMGESALAVTAAMLLAILLACSLLPAFNQLAQKQIHYSQIFTPALLTWLAGIFLANMLCAAFYPAWLLSRLTPIATLSQKQGLSSRNPLGKILMVVQFAAAILLGISSLVFYRQMHFIRSKSLGYNPDQVLKIDIQGVRDVQNITARFRHELAYDREIRAISLAGEFGSRDVEVNGRKFLSFVRTIDTHYAPMLEMRFRSGRNFSPEFGADSESGVLVNEAFVKKAGLKNPIGSTLLPDSYFGKAPFTIIGVVDDFHYNSLKEQIGPMVMPMSTHYDGSALWIKIAQKDQQQTIQKLERTFKKLLPDAVFNYAFLSDSNARAYAMEMRWQRIITLVTAIAIVICSLGLFGLAHLAIAQRRRETGIRIALGASGPEIALLFSRTFIKIISLSIVIALPAGHYLMQKWLENFAYHAGIAWWISLVSGGAALAIAMVTVYMQGLRAAAADPVLALRSE